MARKGVRTDPDRDPADLVDVVDLSLDPDLGGHARERPRARATTGHRVLGALILVVLAVAGLRVNAVNAHPPTPIGAGREPGAAPAQTYPPIPAVVPIPKGSPASATGGAPLAGSNARLLLLGTTLTTYDVSSGRSARPFGVDAGGTVIGAAPLADGDVVIESLGFAGGRAYASEGSHRHDLGYATSVTPGVVMDTAWLTDTPETTGPNRVRLMSIEGNVLAGPYAIPASWRVERAVPGGVLLAVGGTRAPYALHLWTPGQSSPGPLVADNVIADASGGGEVLTVDAGGGVAVNGTPTTLPDGADGYAVSADGATLAALTDHALTIEQRGPAVSADGRTLALPAGSVGRALAFAPSGWLFLSTGSRILALAPGSTALQAVPAVFADPASDLLAGPAISGVANPRVGR